MASQLTFAFDPGGTTGFAALSSDGEILYTTALTLDALEGFVKLLSHNRPIGDKVVIESGPNWSHHSPVTKRAEEICTHAFPDAYLLPPNQWKSHPASRRNDYRFATKHEKEAVGLARCFQALGDTVETNSAGTDSSRTRRKRN